MDHRHIAKPCRILLQSIRRRILAESEMLKLWEALCKDHVRTHIYILMRT